MRVSIQSAINTIYEGNVKEVVLPGKGGEISVLDFHQPFLLCLKKGDIRIREKWLSKQEKLQESKSELRIAIKEGVAKMISNELVAMVDV